jgi:hypothetical protein
MTPPVAAGGERRIPQMGLSPLIGIGVARQDSVLEVVSKGDGTHDHDEVFISTTLVLAQDIDAAGDVTVLLPLASEAQQQPLLRYVGDDVQQHAITFDPVERSVYDQKVADALAAIADGATKKEQKKLAAAVRRSAGSFSQAVLVARPGQRQLRFFFTIAAHKVADREFEFHVLGPLASFVLNPGGSISVLALLARGTSLVSAVGLQDPSNPGSELPKTECDAGARRIVGWMWQYDPLFRVRYRY